MTRKSLQRLVIFSGLAMLGITGLAIEFTSRPSFCRTCHEMRPMYDAWAVSGHREVSCMRCHAEPGPVGLIWTKANGLEEVYRHLTNKYELPIKITTETESFSARCLKCHQNAWSSSQSGPHNPAHKKAGFQCTKCHQGLVHNPQTNKVPPSRELCVKCHGSTNLGSK